MYIYIYIYKIISGVLVQKCIYGVAQTHDAFAFLSSSPQAQRIVREVAFLPARYSFVRNVGGGEHLREVRRCYAGGFQNLQAWHRRERPPRGHLVAPHGGGPGGQGRVFASMAKD